MRHHAQSYLCLRASRRQESTPLWASKRAGAASPIQTATGGLGQDADSDMMPLKALSGGGLRFDEGQKAPMREGWLCKEPTLSQKQAKEPSAPCGIFSSGNLTTLLFSRSCWIDRFNTNSISLMGDMPFGCNDQHVPYPPPPEF